MTRSLHNRSFPPTVPNLPRSVAILKVHYQGKTVLFLSCTDGVVTIQNCDSELRPDLDKILAEGLIEGPPGNQTTLTPRAEGFWNILAWHIQQNNPGTSYSLREKEYVRP